MARQKPGGPPPTPTPFPSDPWNTLAWGPDRQRVGLGGTVETVRDAKHRWGGWLHDRNILGKHVDLGKVRGFQWVTRNDPRTGAEENFIVGDGGWSIHAADDHTYVHESNPQVGYVWNGRWVPVQNQGPIPPFYNGPRYVGQTRTNANRVIAVACAGLALTGADILAHDTIDVGKWMQTTGERHIGVTPSPPTQFPGTSPATQTGAPTATPTATPNPLPEVTAGIRAGAQTAIGQSHTGIGRVAVDITAETQSAYLVAWGGAQSSPTPLAITGAMVDDKTTLVGEPIDGTRAVKLDGLSIGHHDIQLKYVTLPAGYTGEIKVGITSGTALGVSAENGVRNAVPIPALAALPSPSGPAAVTPSSGVTTPGG